MEFVENITSMGKTLAYIIRAELILEKTTFPLPSELNLQVGFIVYSKDSEIARHVHCPIERNIVGTSEVLVVRKGRCEVDFYNEKRQTVTTRELRMGDILILVSGGHGVRMLEDTVLIEVKQGPYTGIDEKERF